jgi:threonine aldolase
MLVDLRSDTVTRPTPAMRLAMAEAAVGDDQYGEDPTVNLLQAEFAALTGKPAALFVPSGVMGNQLALRVLTRPGDAVVVGAHQHVVLYEYGAGPANAGVTWLAVDDARGALDPARVEEAIRGSAYHQPRAAAVFAENTHMAAGGIVWPAGTFEAVAQVAADHGLPVHLDGARLWHAAVVAGRPLAELAGPATTVMCCLSKGLAAPVGSLLAGPAAVIEAAIEERHRMGGAMRQAGIIAAAGLVALRAMRGRLADDHRRAARLAEAIAERWPTGVIDVRRVQTNIVVFQPPKAQAVLEHLGSAGVAAGTIAEGAIRLVTHVDVGDEGLEIACAALTSAP